jgi:ribonucleoside-triphosphate reductase
MCCHLRLDKRELKKRGGGLFGANPLTGSIGVVTLNMPRLGYKSKDADEFFSNLDDLLDLAMQSLEIKRKTVENFTEKGLYPYSRFYLRHTKERYGEYWKNHFSTIGIVGMNECLLNLMDKSIGDPEGVTFAEKVLDYIRERLMGYQEKTGNFYNLEATPAEGTSHSLARKDLKDCPNMIFANQESVGSGGAPYYTNSSLLPVGFTDDLFEALKLQDGLQGKYTGGTVMHIYLGEKKPPVESVKTLVRSICSNYHIPYFTITPTFSICPTHGYVFGEQRECPECALEGKVVPCEVYSRVVGYLRPVDQWNVGKQEEWKQRRMFDSALESKCLSAASRN